jgi:hypothetical protein
MVRDAPGKFRLAVVSAILQYAWWVVGSSIC